MRQTYDEVVHVLRGEEQPQAPSSTYALINELRHQQAQTEAALVEANRTDPMLRDYDDTLNIACAKAAVETWQQAIEVIAFERLTTGI